MNGNAMRYKKTFARIALSTLVAFTIAPALESQSPAEADLVVAEIDGAVITTSEIERALGASLVRLEEQIYALKRDKLQALITERLIAREAANRGISVEALLQREINAKVVVTQQEIEAMLQTNRERLQGNDPSVREQIRTYLQNQKLNAQRDAFIQSLRSHSRVIIHLTPPSVFRADVTAVDGPFRGSQNAPVTLIMFSDLHCPFCKQVRPVLSELLSKYEGKLKIVHKDFPLDPLHPGARTAAEAAHCANEQGKFWLYQDLLYAYAPDATPARLEDLAKQASLDIATFDYCLKSGKYQAAVQKSIEDGVRYGVTGTPAFFINGRPISGAQPLESFVRIIEDELSEERAGR